MNQPDSLGRLLYKVSPGFTENVILELRLAVCKKEALREMGL